MTLCNAMNATDQTKCPGWIWSTTDRPRLAPQLGIEEAEVEHILKEVYI